MYQSGNGVTQDYHQAMAWFQKAAALGDSSAMLGIGLLYENGHGVPRDLTKARIWLEKSAKLGNLLAQNELTKLPPD